VRGGSTTREASLVVGAHGSAGVVTRKTAIIAHLHRERCSPPPTRDADYGSQWVKGEPVDPPVIDCTDAFGDAV
jgi:hypothetical protein